MQRPSNYLENTSKTLISVNYTLPPMIIQRKPPYSDTKIDPFDTQAELSKLLKAYGAEAIQWTSEFTKQDVSLRFSIEVEIKGVKRKLGIEVKPPQMVAKRRTYNQITGHYETVFAPNWAQSMRLLFYYMKSKLEAISYGLIEAEREFFAQVITSLPGGFQGTVFDILKDQALGLPAPEQTGGKIIDVEIVEQKEG